MNSSFKDIILDFKIVGKIMSFGTFHFLYIHLFLLLRKEFMQRDNKQKNGVRRLGGDLQYLLEAPDRVMAKKNYWCQVINAKSSTMMKRQCSWNARNTLFPGQGTLH